MPKQCGPIQITGTIDNVCFYKMDGVYYARMKSSLTRKRVLKSAAFRRTREHAAILGEASKIASQIYRLIPKDCRKHTLYREMTGKAIYLLREGKDKEVVFQRLSGLYLNPETRWPSVLQPEPDQKESVGEAHKLKNTVRVYFSAPRLKDINQDWSRYWQHRTRWRVFFRRKGVRRWNYAMGP